MSCPDGGADIVSTAFISFMVLPLVFPFGLSFYRSLEARNKKMEEEITASKLFEGVTALNSEKNRFLEVLSSVYRSAGNRNWHFYKDKDSRFNRYTFRILKKITAPEGVTRLLLENQLLYFVVGFMSAGSPGMILFRLGLLVNVTEN